MITGSAPLSESVLTFIRCAMGCIVLEGYGQTECVAAATVTIEGDFEPGQVGVPSPCNAIKLVDVPELGYFSKDKAGEVCIRGTNVFKGYYQMPEQTREALDEEGWLHTGDIGRWTEHGTLKIVDRKKHIFKLAQVKFKKQMCFYFFKFITKFRASMLLRKRLKIFMGVLNTLRNALFMVKA